MKVKRNGGALTAEVQMQQQSLNTHVNATILERSRKEMQSKNLKFSFHFVILLYWVATDENRKKKNFLGNFSSTKCEKAKDSETFATGLCQCTGQKDITSLLPAAWKRLELHIHEIIGGQATLKHNRGIETAGWGSKTCHINPLASTEDMTHAILYWQQAEEKHKKIENVEFSVGGSK